jgi:hypothetical protein
MIELLEKLLPSLLTAVVAAVITARLSLRKFYSEKWWDRKEKAYTELIEALYDLLQYCEIKKEDYGDGGGYTKDYLEEQEKRYSVAYWRIKRAAEIGAFVISPKAAKVLQQLIERPKLEWNSNAPWDIYADDYQHYKEALGSIREFARKDLRSKHA